MSKREMKQEMDTEKSKGEPDSQVGLVDYLDEFIQALRKQLHSDFLRWGNTWRNRPKEGQEMRTMYRYDDYFDMFRETGEPVPWLKITGNALICWIRENHPEVCVDASEVDVAGIPVEGTKGEKAIEDMTIKELVELDPRKIKPMSHVDGERLTHLCGHLSYAKGDGYLRLASIIFTKGNDSKSEVVGRCNADGIIIQPEKGKGLDGRVLPDGGYRIVAAPGLLSTDEIYISYDYDYALAE